MTAENTQYILILDLGKTHSKVTLVDLAMGSGQVTRTTTNKSAKNKNYCALDIEAIWDWFLLQLGTLNHTFPVKQIIVTTHGAAAALIGKNDEDNELIFPVMDYEVNHLDEIKAQYLKIRPPFSETGSIDLPQGLNLGRQLFWLQHTYPKKWKEVNSILMLPQYFCWRLSGIAVSEITSLGCHTDLWDLADMKLSSLVYQCNWQHLFPEIKPPGAVLGPIKKSLATRLNLSTHIEILNGIHDSNASLLPYLNTMEKNCNIISSGTWVVINHMSNHGLNRKKNPTLQNNNKTDLHSDLSLADGIMFSVDAQGDIVSSLRFMGGREWSIIQENDIADCTLSDIQYILTQQIFPLPAFEKSGPFAQHKGCFYFTNEHVELDNHRRSALATIYLVLMSQYCLERLNAINSQHTHQSTDTIVEGVFVKNKIYMQLLQTLNFPERVFYNPEETGTTSGASRLSRYANLWPPVKLDKINLPSLSNFKSYYQSWLSILNRGALKSKSPTR